MADKPAIVLVHGFWGGAAHWAKVITELHRRGFGSLHAVENPLTSLADDAERTRKMVRQIDGPVVLVGHSYGGAVITEAGDLPGVTGLVYIAAFAPDAGESPGQISQEKPPPRSRTSPRTPTASHASLASQPGPVTDLIEEAAAASAG
ncbi:MULTISPECIES: alpha/beta fold hydrolase [Streptomyces]|uniref:alpha/beta fold hydrolase n=1 Tax=Streptomyces TaxID=1883 RepID=UPI0015CF034E|nr:MULTISPECIES: alpha/beta hydrolase [unclassified Streptomyces]WTF64123.1 alpha/beta hydrolase [Streptomyces anulatus]